MRTFAKLPRRASLKRARRRRLVRGVVLLTVLSLGPAAIGACRESEPTPELPESSALSDLEVGRIGGRIYNEPEHAEQILGEADVAPEEFEERVREITDDPERSREYTRGFESIAVLPQASDSLGGAAGADPEPGG